jgi:hypothetical protein
MTPAAAATETRLIHTESRLIATLGLMLAIAVPGQRCVADEILAPIQVALRLPSDSAANRGFVAKIEIAYHDIAGYVPLEFTITSTSRFTADRNFILRLEPLPGARTPPRNGMMIEVPAAVAGGTKSVTLHRCVPKWSAGHSYRVRLFEDGQPLPGYEGLIGNPVLQGGSRSLDVLAREYRSDWVFIDAKNRVTGSDERRIRKMLMPLTDQLRVPRSRRGSYGGVSLTVVGQEDMPEDWRGYQRYDMVIFSAAGLQELSSHPARLETLRQWVLAGGAVLGFDVASPEKVTRQLNFCLTDRLESRSQIVKRADTIIKQREHEQSMLQERRREAETYLATIESGAAIAPGLGRGLGQFDAPVPPSLKATPASLQAIRDDIADIIEQQRAHAKLRKQKPWLNLTANEWPDRIWTQSAGAGMIVGLNSDQGVISEMHWQLAAPALANQASPTLRRGVDPLIGDRRFSQWMIPGVAQPPVYTFIGLLTAFVILVGPIAYRRTTRYGRGYLMFAIAPVLAMVTTLAMFGYGIVADGFGTIARVRQLTWIDGASGDAAQRVRSTYFAGVRPGDGLTFPAEAEVIGYPESSGVSWEESDKSTPAIVGKVWISDQRQVFDSSFLPSRQQRQFVVHQPKPSTGVVSLRSDPGVAPQLLSTLSFSLIRVVARDAAGNYWSADTLLPGESVAADSLSPQDASKRLGTMYTEHLPVSAVREATQRNDYRRQTRDLQVNISRAIGDEASLLLDGYFENWLKEHLQLKGGLPPKHFVGMAEVSDDVLAVDQAELVESIHYVYGTMP